MEGESCGKLSAEGLRYLDAAFLKLISEEVHNKYSNFEEFYGELRLNQDILNGMETTG